MLETKITEYQNLQYEITKLETQITDLTKMLKTNIKDQTVINEKVKDTLFHDNGRFQRVEKIVLQNKLSSIFEQEEIDAKELYKLAIPELKEKCRQYGIDDIHAFRGRLYDYRKDPTPEMYETIIILVTSEQHAFDLQFLKSTAAKEAGEPYYISLRCRKLSVDELINTTEKPVERFEIRF